MGRKISFALRFATLPVFTWPWPWARAGLAAAACIAAAWVVQDAAGSEIGGTVQKHGERLERVLRGKGDKLSPTPPPPQRSPDEPIQPWERVSV